MSAGRIEAVGLIAGNGRYPFEWVRHARKAGVSRIAVAGFDNETDPALAEQVDEIQWMRVGQMAKLLSFFKERKLRFAVMAGQIAPKNLFDLSPDFKALLVLASLKRRNAETIFGAIAGELAKIGTELLPATTFLEELIPGVGPVAGPRPSKRQMEDIQFGFDIAKQISRLDIGQTVVVKHGTVLAVEGFDGTNATIRRGGELGRKESVMVKVSKPNQDLRFDVPVVGPTTLEIAAESKIGAIGIEAGKTLLIEKERVFELAALKKITIVAL